MQYSSLNVVFDQKHPQRYVSSGGRCEGVFTFTLALGKTVTGKIISHFWSQEYEVLVG